METDYFTDESDYDIMVYHFDYSINVKILPEIYYEENIKPLLLLIRLFRIYKIPDVVIHNIFMYYFKCHDKVIVLYDLQRNKLIVQPIYFWLNCNQIKKLMNLPKIVNVSICDKDECRENAYKGSRPYLYVKISERTHYFVEYFESKYTNKNPNYIYYCNSKKYYDKNDEEKTFLEAFEFFANNLNEYEYSSYIQNIIKTYNNNIINNDNGFAYLFDSNINQLIELKLNYWTDHYYVDIIIFFKK